MDSGRPDIAERHLISPVPVARGLDTAGDMIASVTDGGFVSIDPVFVLDDQGRLQGHIRLSSLFGAERDAKAKDLMKAGTPAALPGDDQEHVAALAMRGDIPSVPVVDSDDRLLGAVPSGTIFEILRREHIEDMNRLVGIWKENGRARDAIEASPTRRIRDRLPWLLVGLIGSMSATFVVSGFSSTLEAHISIAFFIPVIVYLADAIGTQTEAVAIRGLSLSKFPATRLLSGEMRTGIFMGAALGGLSLPFTLLAFGDAGLAFAVALSIMAAGASAASMGFLFPWILSRSGRDPALGSGPVATVIQDILSLLIYFIIASVLVT